ncbi:MAG: hypothetical protein KAT40_01365 [Bacteroidales bacterium]|nr:hypothetical protein [Bacteroidales bacterium]
MKSLYLFACSYRLVGNLSAGFGLQILYKFTTDQIYLKKLKIKFKNIDLAIEADSTKDIRWKISEVGKQYLASHN